MGLSWNCERGTMSELNKMICIDTAKASIEAMKEPTQAMLDAGAYDLDMTLEQQWQRMIEAALKDE